MHKENITVLTKHNSLHKIIKNVKLKKCYYQSNNCKKNTTDMPLQFMKSGRENCLLYSIRFSCIQLIS